MMTTETMNGARTDADLVAESRGGNREAFRQIVERYKTLICSLAYNGTGSLSQSEDVAQETFITAWKSLGSLQEPAKLRSWLCGIVRNCIYKHYRREGREPVHDAESLEAVHDSAADAALPSEQAINREEEAILWRSLERIHESYREPLILYYREHQSIATVAAELDLSEDAVKQRLARGRKLLQEEVQAFVEKTLQRSAPGQAFSGMVLAALPAATAGSAGMGLGAKGASAAKSGAWFVWLMPFIGVLAAFTTHWLVIDATTPAHERRAKRLRLLGWYVGLLVCVVGGENLVWNVCRHYQVAPRGTFVVLTWFWWCIGLGCVTWMVWALRRNFVLHKERLAAANPPVWNPGARLTIAAGVQLAMLSWLVPLAWGRDPVSVGIMLGIMLVMGFWHFKLIGRHASDTARWFCVHIGLECLLVAVLFNLRFPLWLAAAHGVGVAEIYQLRPLFMIPWLTLALAVWAGVFWMLTSLKRH